MSRDRGRKRHSEGFTIFEALVAVAVLSSFLAATSLLVGTSLRGTWSTESHLRLLQTARTLFTGFVDRDQLKAGTYHGSTGNAQWTLNVRPYASGETGSIWIPQELTLNVRPNPGVSGRTSGVTFRTVRLQLKEVQ